MKYIIALLLAIAIPVSVQGNNINDTEKQTKANRERNDYRGLNEFQLDSKHWVIVAEGDYEGRSTGSYTVRVYDYDPKYPTSGFICGFVQPRYGALENVLFEDLDGDGKKEIIVTARCVGTSQSLYVDAFSFSNKKLTYLEYVGLESHEDPVVSLKRKFNNSKNKQSLNQVIHPAVFEMIESWTSDTPYPVATEINLDAVVTNTNQFQTKPITNEDDWVLYTRGEREGWLRYRTLEEDGHIKKVLFQNNDGGSFTSDREITFEVKSKAIEIEGERQTVRVLEVISISEATQWMTTLCSIVNIAKYKDRYMCSYQYDTVHSSAVNSEGKSLKDTIQQHTIKDRQPVKGQKLQMRYRVDEPVIYELLEPIIYVEDAEQ